MKFLDIIQSASSNLWRNKGRTILTIIAIFIGAFTISLTSGVNSGINSYLDQQLREAGSKDTLMITPESLSNGKALLQSKPKEYSPDSVTDIRESYLTDQDVSDIKNMDNIEKAEPFYRSSPDYIQGDTNKKYLVTTASKTDVEISLEAGRAVTGNTTDYEVALAPEYVESLGYSSAKDAVGKTVKLGVTSQASGEQETVEAKIVGVRNVSLTQQGRSIISKGLASKIVEMSESGMPDSMKHHHATIFAEMKKGLSAEQMTAVKKQLEDAGYAAQTVEDEMVMIRQLVNAVTGVLTLFAAIALLAASFGIINTLYMSVQDRTREIGLMKAMGMSGGKVFLTFSIEALLIGFWGGLLGIGGAVAVGHFLNDLAVSTFLDGLTGFTLIQFSFFNMIVIILIIMLIAFLAGTLPANRAARLDPINALRYE